VRLPKFEYHRPTSLEELSGLLREYGETAALVGGGTDLYVRMKERLITPSHCISVSCLPGISQISPGPQGGLLFGSGVSLGTITASKTVLATCPALTRAAALVATRQIRNMASLGGNILQNTRCCYYNRSFEWRKAVPLCIKRGGEICHVVEKSRRCFAVYQGDLAPLIIALRGTAILTSGKGEEERPLEDLFTGDGRTPFRNIDGNALVAIRIPAPFPSTFAAYRKFRIRKGTDFPLAGAAVAIDREGDTVSSIRICLTGVAPSPVVVKEAQSLASGKVLDAKLMKELAEAAFRSAHPVANLEEGPARRRSMVRTMVEEILEEASSEIEAESSGVRSQESGVASPGSRTSIPDPCTSDLDPRSPILAPQTSIPDPRSPTVTLNVNGEEHTVTAENRDTLLEVLRNRLGLTGAKEACGTGECGTCTVLIDNKPILACLTLAVEAEGRKVVTIEGLAPEGRLSPVQKAFVEYGAVQCGFCTPGMILSATSLLAENPAATREEIAKALEGNLCRCTGYNKIVEAVERARDKQGE
jgi:4-hydroxybenzoyl-CoA reductase subunit beta